MKNIILLLLLFFTSCSIVKSNTYKPITKTHNKTSTENYDSIKYNNPIQKGMMYYYLPETLIKLNVKLKVQVQYYEDIDSNGNTIKKLDKNQFIIQQVFTTTIENIPDNKQFLMLNYKKNFLMSDEIKFKINTKGLLQTATISSDDKTPSIITKITQSPTDILKNTSASTLKNKIIHKTLKDFALNLEFKISDLATSDSLNIENKFLIINEFNNNNFVTKTINFTIKTDDLKIKNDTVKISKNEITKVTDEITTISSDGILVRPVKMIEIKYSSDQFKNDNNVKIVAKQNIQIIDVNKLINIPIKRSAFSKRTDSLVLIDGMLSSNEITNPSSAEGFISIPINIAKAIVKIPGQIISFKYDNTLKKTNLENQKKLLNDAIFASEKFSLERESKIQDIIRTIESEKLTNNDALEKLKSDLKTAKKERENLLEKLNTIIQNQN